MKKTRMTAFWGLLGALLGSLICSTAWADQALLDAYKKEFAFLQAQKKALQQRLQHLEKKSQQRVRQAKDRVLQLQGQILRAQDQAGKLQQKKQ